MIIKVRKAERSCHAVQPSFKTSKDNRSLVAVEVLEVVDDVAPGLISVAHIYTNIQSYFELCSLTNLFVQFTRVLCIWVEIIV